MINLLCCFGAGEDLVPKPPLQDEEVPEGQGEDGTTPEAVSAFTQACRSASASQGRQAVLGHGLRREHRKCGIVQRARATFTVSRAGRRRAATEGSDPRVAAGQDGTDGSTTADAGLGLRTSAATHRHNEHSGHGRSPARRRASAPCRTAQLDAVAPSGILPIRRKYVIVADRSDRDGSRGDARRTPGTLYRLCEPRSHYRHDVTQLCVQ